MKRIPSYRFKLFSRWGSALPHLELWYAAEARVQFMRPPSRTPRTASSKVKVNKDETPADSSDGTWSRLPAITGRLHPTCRHEAKHLQESIGVAHSETAVVHRNVVLKAVRQDGHAIYPIDWTEDPRPVLTEGCDVTPSTYAANIFKNIDKSKAKATVCSR